MSNKMQPKRDPLVSIIMPAFNASETISDSIHSILNQSYKEWELLIVNDHSFDSTANLVNKLQNNESRIKLIDNNKKGVSSARNRGIETSRGEFIAFLDADDIYFENALSKRVEYLLKKHVDAVYCETEMTDHFHRSIGLTLRGKKVITFYDFYVCPFHINSVMIRSRILSSIRFEENFANGEDWLFFSRLARMGLTFYKVANCRVSYRQHDSTVRRHFMKHENTLIEVIEILYKSDPGCPNPFSDYKEGLKLTNTNKYQIEQINSLLNKFAKISLNVLERLIHIKYNKQLLKFINNMKSRNVPNRETVIMKRRVGLLINLILDENYLYADIIGQELNNYDIFSINIDDVLASIKNSIIRYYTCNTQLWIHYFILNSTSLERYIKKYLSSSIWEQVQQKLNIEAGSTFTTSRIDNSNINT